MRLTAQLSICPFAWASILAESLSSHITVTHTRSSPSTATTVIKLGEEERGLVATRYVESN